MASRVGKISIAVARGLGTLLFTRSSVKEKVDEALRACRLVSHRNIIVDLCKKFFDIPDILKIFADSFDLEGLFRLHKEIDFDENTDDDLSVMATVYDGIDSLLPKSRTLTTEAKGEFHLNMMLVLLYGYKVLDSDLLTKWMSRIMQYASWKYQLTEFPTTIFSRSSLKRVYLEEVESVDDLDLKINELLGLRIQPPAMEKAVRLFFGPATDMSEQKLRSLAAFPLAFEAFFMACTVAPRLQLDVPKPKRVVRSRGSAVVTGSSGVQFPGVKVMRLTKFRTTFSKNAIPYVVSSQGLREFDLFVVAKETYDFMVATCASNFFKDVDPMCCALVLKPGYSRCHLLASNPDLARSNACLKYDDPAHPNTYFIQLMGCFPAFVVMMGDTVRFYLAPVHVVKQLRNSSGRIDPDSSSYRPPFFDGWDSDFSCRQGADLAGLRFVMSGVMAHIAVLSTMIDGLLLTEESSCKVQDGPGVKEFWVSTFLSFFKKAFSRLKDEVEMIPKEAFQVTAAFLSCPTPNSFTPEAFKRATLGNLIALAGNPSAPPQPLPAPPIRALELEMAEPERLESDDDEDDFLNIAKAKAVAHHEQQFTPESSPGC